MLDDGGGGGASMAPFDKHSADPTAIEDQAGLLVTLAGKAIDQQVITDRAFNPAIANWDGIAAPELQAAPEPVRTKAELASSALAWASVPLRFWAANVRTFNSAVDAINANLATQAARHYGARGTDGAPATTEQISAARADALAAARNLWWTAYNTHIEDGRTTAASMFTEGPTEENMNLARFVGAFPPDSAILAAFSASWSNRPQELINTLIAQGILPHEFEFLSFDEAMDYLEAHPDLARQLDNLVPGNGDPLSNLLASVIGPQLTDGSTSAMDISREALEGLSPSDLAWLAMLYPAAMGNLSGAPFSARIIANRVRIIAELDREQDRLDRLEERDERKEDNNTWIWRSWDDNDLNGDISGSRKRIELYESILNDDRLIVYFDPAGDGSMIEAHGTIGPTTSNVGIYVEGVGTELTRYGDVSGRARSFYEQAHSTDPGSLVMFSWLVGDMPEGVTTPVSNGPSDGMAPALAMFSHEVRQEMQYRIADPSAANITVAGHSYGGAIVGTAELHGLDADRVLHIASIGLGHDVDSVEDYNNPNADVQRYSMMAPGDRTGVLQDRSLPGVGRVGHGPDPEEAEGVTRLYTGNYLPGSDQAGEPVRGHDAIFDANTESWRQMYNVFTGGEVVLYREEEVCTYDPLARIYTCETHEHLPGETVDIP